MILLAREKGTSARHLITSTLIHFVSLIFMGILLLCLLIFMIPELQDIAFRLIEGKIILIPLWAALVCISAMFGLMLRWMVIIYRSRNTIRTKHQSAYWMLVTLGHSLSLAILVMSTITVVLSGIDSLILDQLLILLFFSLLIEGSAQMLYFEATEIPLFDASDCNDVLRLRCHHRKQSVHHSFMAINIFVVTVMTYTGVTNGVWMYIGVLLLVSVIFNTIFGLLLFHTRLEFPGRVQNMDLIKNT